jgi:hypothetical protein
MQQKMINIKNWKTRQFSDFLNIFFYSKITSLSHFIFLMEELGIFDCISFQEKKFSLKMILERNFKDHQML